MGISISGSNAISGLGGQDTDFDKVLSQLKQIESTQLNRLEAWKSDWNLRYEAFTQIIEQIQAASSLLSQLSDKNNFVTKLVQSSNDNIVTAVANAAAQDVQHTIKVSQVASNAIWANSHVYESKTDIINTTGVDQTFNFTYAGKKHEFKVPKNTTLDSFVSMFNNSADNPGLKISLIQTGNGYVFQVAGKSTGAANDLIIHDSNLVGMSYNGTTSNWQTNNSLDISSPLTDPNTYVYDMVMMDGTKKSVTVKGNATAQELAVQLTNSAGGITASVDSSGNLTIQGVQSFSRRLASDKEYVPASTKFSIDGALKDANGDYKKLTDLDLGAGLSEDDELQFTVLMDDGTERVITVKAGATTRDLMVALGGGTQDSGGVDVESGNGKVSATLKGVKEIKGIINLATGANITAGWSQEKNAATGVKDTLGGAMSATTTITIDPAKLGDRIDGKTSGDGDMLTYTVLDKDGNAYFINISSDKTNQDLLDEMNNVLSAAGVLDSTGSDPATGKYIFNNIKSFKLTTGSVSSPAYTVKSEGSVLVSATNPNPDNSDGSTSKGNLFHLDSTTGKYLCEEAPDLVYTVVHNDGTKGTLTMPSGTSMKDVLKAMQNSSSWTWTNADGTAASAPADWKVTFTDEDGNEVTDLDNHTGNVLLNAANTQSISGPSIKGQVESSSLWNIQRASNARYQVDNWPVEMESETNSISDVIEGVVFDIQDVGDARISVSTDITSVEQSIQNFLDAVNSVLLTVNELMKFDETKQVTSNDPNDIGSDNYSPSGLTNQKGGLLMGNYGVQLFKSRFSSMLGTTPPGFKSRQSADDILSGDVLASLANLGIKTDTDATSDTYGLLVIAPSSSIGALQSMDKENYTNMINNNLEAVVDFFCSSGVGASTSTDFRYGSHVEGITAAGSYEVKYTVLADGTITNVTIGGEPATQDLSQPGNYFSVASGDPRGLSILIDDLTEGDHPPAGGEPQYIRIKQGLVQTTNNFLKAELVFNDVNISSTSTPDQVADAIALKSKNGALMSLRDNYMKVMESIDVKIEREQRRISTWESRQKAIFANLETLLKQYSEQQTQLEAQLKQLSGNS